MRREITKFFRFWVKMARIHKLEVRVETGNWDCPPLSLQKTIDKARPSPKLEAQVCVIHLAFTKKFPKPVVRAGSDSEGDSNRKAGSGILTPGAGGEGD